MPARGQRTREHWCGVISGGAWHPEGFARFELQILGGPERIRSRTCAIVDFQGLGASIHQVAPASANAAILRPSSLCDLPAVVPNLTMSNSVALLRFFSMNALTSFICSTVRSASISADTGTTPSYFAARRNGRGRGHVAATQIGIRFCIGAGRKRIGLSV